MIKPIISDEFLPNSFRLFEQFESVTTFKFKKAL